MLGESRRAGFDWSVLDIGVKVAALMTEAIIARRLPRPVEADRVIVPGRCRADLDKLSRRIRRAVRCAARRTEGPAGFFRQARAQRSICRATTCASSPRSSMRPRLTVEAIVERARGDARPPAPT